MTDALQIWVTPEGEHFIVPDELLSVRITKSGWPDKRDPKYKEFMDWAESVRLPQELDAMNAYALRIWNGQSIDLPRKERMARIVASLKVQGYTDEQLAVLTLPE